jgi:hypothetical protein
VVHNVLEKISQLPVKERFIIPLPIRFAEEWQKFQGKKGGFLNDHQEYQYKKRGQEMIANLYHNQGPLLNLAVKIKQDLPQFWLSEEENIILCGKLDWLEYLVAEDAVHIIDFKTGQKKEDLNSLQLPIYYLLAEKCQPRPVIKMSYWYLLDKNPVTVQLPNKDELLSKILKMALKIKLARQLKKFDCLRGQEGCFACKSYDKISKGQATLIGIDDYERDVYILEDENDIEEVTSIIL